MRSLGKRQNNLIQLKRIGLNYIRRQISVAYPQDRREVFGISLILFLLRIKENCLSKSHRNI